MPTQESTVKRRIKEVLKKFPNIYIFMPVQFGYGEATIDYLICYANIFIGIEAKAPGKRPTPLQEECIRKIRAAGGQVFVIDGTPQTNTYEELERYLTTLSRFTQGKELI